MPERTLRAGSDVRRHAVGMETRKIGSLEVSLVGLGCNNFGMRIDADRTAEVVRAALAEGITLFDTADIYGGGQSEEFLGRALGSARDDVIVATKFGGRWTVRTPTSCGRRARRRSRGSARTASTCTRCTGPTTTCRSRRRSARCRRWSTRARCGRSAAPTSTARGSTRAAEASAAKGTAAFVTLQNQLSLLDRRQQGDTIALGRAPRARHPPVLPAGQRDADRQVPAGHAAARGHAAVAAPRGPGQEGVRRPLLRHGRAAHRLRGRARPHASSSWPCPGSPACPRWPRSSPERPRPSRCGPTRPPPAWKLSDDEMAEVDQLSRR